MTCCLLVKAPDRLVAVADGRLSVGSSAKSFETTMKIVRFAPLYRIPQVMMSRFSHYEEFTGRSCFVAYAGNYALVEQVMQLFRQRITEGLVLLWEDGELRISEGVFDENVSYLEYDLPRPYPQITAHDVLRQFRQAAQVKCNEFCANRIQPADCEFLLFGQGERRDYWAYRIVVDPLWAPGGPVRLMVDEVADGVLTAIGSSVVVGAAFADDALLTGLEGWRVDQQRLGMYDFDLDKPKETSHITPLVQDPRNWPSKEVISRFRELLRDSGDFSVGGSHTIAQGGWYGEVSLKPVP